MNRLTIQYDSVVKDSKKENQFEVEFKRLCHKFDMVLEESGFDFTQRIRDITYERKAIAEGK